jgi:hypothetical protein
MKRVAEAAALRSAICARSVCDDLVVFPVSGLLYFKRHAFSQCPIPCCWSVGTRPHRAVNSAGWTASPDPVAAGRSGHPPSAVNSAGWAANREHNPPSWGVTSH